MNEPMKVSELIVRLEHMPKEYVVRAVSDPDGGVVYAVRRDDEHGVVTIYAGKT